MVRLLAYSFFFVSLTGCDAFLDSRLATAFLTEDQLGRIAFEKQDYQKAAEHFSDPLWRGISLYQISRYEQASMEFGRVRTADSLYNMGVAMIRHREYSNAILAFEQALELDKNHAPAQQNLDVTRAIIAYLNKARQGEGSEIGADEYRFDKSAEGGLDTIISEKEVSKMETADQWMRMVETRPKDFLRTKFALEASR